MIKAVLFDIDGVLLDSFEANWKFISDLMEHFGYTAPTREEYIPLFHRPLKEEIKTISGSTSEEEIEKIWQAGKDKTVRYPIELLKMPENVLETIQNLTQEYTLGIVTSRVRENVYSMPQLADLKEYFKVVVSFQDTKKHKPYPDPLLLAAQKLGVLPEEVVYVGDVENDVIAAKAASMKSILYSQEKSEKADAITFVFEELPKTVKSLIN